MQLNDTQKRTSWLIIFGGTLSCMSFFFLPLIMNVAIVGVLSILFLYAKKQTHAQLKIRHYVFGIGLSILCLGFFFIAQTQHSTSQIEGSFTYHHEFEDVYINGEVFHLITTEQVDENGFFQPITNNVTFPNSNYFYNERIIATNEFHYDFSLVSTINFENCTIKFYSDDDFIDLDHTLIYSTILFNQGNFTKMVNNVRVMVYEINGSIDLFTPNAEEITVLQFNLIAFLNQTYYAENSETIYNAETTISIDSLPSTIQTQETWGKTTSIQFSLGNVLERNTSAMAFFGGCFLCLFIIIFLFGYLAQRPKTMTYYLLLEVLIGILILIYFEARALDDNPIIKSIIDGVIQMQANLGLGEWVNFVVILLYFAALSIQAFYWTITIGVSLALCAFMLFYVKVISDQSS